MVRLMINPALIRAISNTGQGYTDFQDTKFRAREMMDHGRRTKFVKGVEGMICL